MHNLAALFVFLFAFQSVSAETNNFYTVGDHVAPITLEDQYDKTASIDESTRLVLFTTGMPGGKVARKAIDKETDSFLSDNHAVFLSNISGMPRMVAKMFALPNMRKHPYSIVLDREGKVTEKFPSEDGSTTIIVLDKLEIKSIEFTKDPSLVKKAITSTEH